MNAPKSMRQHLPKQHELRASLGRVLHERPFVPVSTPSQITYLAWEQASDNGEIGREWIRELCETAGVVEPLPDAAFHHVEFESFTLKWERHTEFSSVAFIRNGAVKEPFVHRAYRFTPSGWIERLPGKILAAVEICVEPSAKGRPDGCMYKDSLVSSRVAGGKAQVWTDFRHHADGFSRFYIGQAGASIETIGRLVQRLLEVEVYRTLALHGFAAAKKLSPKLVEIERALAAVTDTMSTGDHESCLQRLLEMSANVERFAAETSFRFSATRAYSKIVQERCEALKEREIQGLSTLSEFIERRFQPAVRTCRAVEEHREILSGHLGRAVSLLNIQVSSVLEAQNRAESVENSQRAARSLHLQETVEGLSVIAIAYYASGLLGYIFNAMHRSGLDFDPNTAKGFAVPVVLMITWFNMKRIHRKR